MAHRNPLLLPLLLLLLAGGTAVAQETERTTSREVGEQFYKEISEFAVGYWVPRLNGYKVRIDRSLPTSELATLDALRIQWGIMIERQKEGTAMTEARHDSQPPMTEEHYNDTPGSADQSAVAAPEPMAYDMNEPAPGVDAGATAPVAAEVEPARSSEPTERNLFESTQEIAGRNRERMDAIHGLVRADVNEFIEEGMAFVDRFLEKNRDRILASDDTEVIESWNEVRASLLSGSGREDLLAAFDRVYEDGAESFIMLYNGEDLFRLLGVALPASAPLSDLRLETSSMLAQNIPNPAGGSTRIGYTLTAPSSSTSIEIFDASGAKVLSIDQGARPVGEHSVTVDLSKLATGSYLYRLTIQGEHGEQVSSRVMQVVR